MHYLDIVDCNAGDHGKAFATNFNPEINIREVTQKGRYWENGKWIETKPHEIKKALNYPNIGPKNSYVIYHEELESLVKNFPTLKRARFWMTFGDEYLTHLRVIQNIGMASIEPIMYKGVEIIPLQFLKEVLPNPGDLGENYTGETSIGCRIRGIKDGKRRLITFGTIANIKMFIMRPERKVFLIQLEFRNVGAKMLLTGKWKKPGVFNVE